MKLHVLKLKYLDLSGFSRNNSICNFENLEKLNLDFCFSLDDDKFNLFYRMLNN